MRASSLQFAKELKSTGESIHFLAKQLTEWAGDALGIENVELDVLDSYDGVVDVLDGLLEKADGFMDDIRGTRHVPKGCKPQFDMKMVQNIVKPQLKFQDKIDNRNDTPFRLKIKEKPNALRPLDDGHGDDVTDEMKQHIKSLGILDSTTAFIAMPHPYKYEIENMKYPEHLMTASKHHHLEMTEPHVWVDSLEALECMITELLKYPEIAVDTEAHSMRSFQGFVCLIQISTVDCDYLVDALVLRHDLHLLNKVFTKPDIVKVMHGAESDVVWLQRDFGVYLVNLFDTYHASHVLEMGQHSYAFLLKNYCKVETDKKYQLADWRVRPLSEEMILYARMDTHYLLYIFDQMKQALLKDGTIKEVLSRSRVTSLKVYSKDFYNAASGLGPGGWKSCLTKNRAPLDAVGFSVFKALHQWRDSLAREEDESPHYVLPNPTLFFLSTHHPESGKSLINSAPSVTPLLRLYANDVAKLITTTIESTTAEMENRKRELEVVRREMQEKEVAWKEKFGRARHSRFDEDGNILETTEEAVPVVPVMERRDLVKPIAIVESPRLQTLVHVDVPNLEKVEQLKRSWFDSEKIIAPMVFESPRQSKKSPEPARPELDIVTLKEAEGLPKQSLQIREDLEVEMVQVGNSKKRKRRLNKAQPSDAFDYSTAQSTVKDAFEAQEKTEGKRRGIKEKFDVKEMKFMMTGQGGEDVDGDEIHHEKRKKPRVETVKTNKTGDVKERKDEEKEKKVDKREARLASTPMSGNKTIHMK